MKTSSVGLPTRESIQQLCEDPEKLREWFSQRLGGVDTYFAADQLVVEHPTIMLKELIEANWLPLEKAQAATLQLIESEIQGDQSNLNTGRYGEQLWLLGSTVFGRNDVLKKEPEKNRLLLQRISDAVVSLPYPDDGAEHNVKYAGARFLARFQQIERRVWDEISRVALNNLGCRTQERMQIAFRDIDFIGCCLLGISRASLELFPEWVREIDQKLSKVSAVWKAVWPMQLYSFFFHALHQEITEPLKFVKTCERFHKLDLSESLRTPLWLALTAVGRRLIEPQKNDCPSTDVMVEPKPDEAIRKIIDHLRTNPVKDLKHELHIIAARAWAFSKIPSVDDAKSAIKKLISFETSQESIRASSICIPLSVLNEPAVCWVVTTRSSYFSALVSAGKWNPRHDTLTINAKKYFQLLSADPFFGKGKTQGKPLGPSGNTSVKIAESDLSLDSKIDKSFRHESSLPAGV